MSLFLALADEAGVRWEGAGPDATEIVAGGVRWRIDAAGAGEPNPATGAATVGIGAAGAAVPPIPAAGVAAIGVAAGGSGAPQAPAAG
ncbi:MAG: hypothetical protein ACK4KW_14235, partial [Gemmobacter sp.]